MRDHPRASHGFSGIAVAPRPPPPPPPNPLASPRRAVALQSSVRSLSSVSVVASPPPPPGFPPEVFLARDADAPLAAEDDDLPDPATAPGLFDDIAARDAAEGD
jgi:hypothetical protein